MTIVGTYFLLNAENYHWHWTAFSAGASTCECGGYLLRLRSGGCVLRLLLAAQVQHAPLAVPCSCLFLHQRLPPVA